MEGILVLTSLSEQTASEDVRLSGLDSSGIADLHECRGGRRGFVLQRQRHGAVATASGLAQDIALNSLVGEDPASEQIILPGLDLGGIGSSFLFSEEEVQMNRTVAERVYRRTA